MSRQQFIEALDAIAAEGAAVHLWLRDDDAIEPTAQLSRLLDRSSRWQIPMTLAVIPAPATTALAELLEGRREISVAVHGWDHRNHAPPPEKKQELGLHRDPPAVLATLSGGLQRIYALFGERAVPLLVPPWNRIAPALVAGLPELGYEGLSVFGRDKPSPVPLFNTHVDIIDWKGSRGGRGIDELYGDATAYLLAKGGPARVLGVLTHHLVHDDAAWQFLDDLFELTIAHPACRWVSIRQLMGRA